MKTIAPKAGASLTGNPTLTKNKGFSIEIKPAVGQVWRVIGVFGNPLFSIGREFTIEAITSVHYNSRWNDGGGPCYFKQEGFLDKCELAIVKPKIDMGRYPHECPRCGSAAYVGATAAVDCTGASCPTKKG